MSNGKGMIPNRASGRGTPTRCRSNPDDSHLPTTPPSYDPSDSDHAVPGWLSPIRPQSTPQRGDATTIYQCSPPLKRKSPELLDEDSPKRHCTNKSTGQDDEDLVRGLQQLSVMPQLSPTASPGSNMKLQGWTVGLPTQRSSSQWIVHGLCEPPDSQHRMLALRPHNSHAHDKITREEHMPGAATEAEAAWNAIEAILAKQKEHEAHLDAILQQSPLTTPMKSPMKHFQTTPIKKFDVAQPIHADVTEVCQEVRGSATADEGELSFHAPQILNTCSQNTAQEDPTPEEQGV